MPRLILSFLALALAVAAFGAAVAVAPGLLRLGEIALVVTVVASAVIAYVRRGSELD
jgi:hypothetical protein